MMRERGYAKGMVESKIQSDALLLTGVKENSTANRTFGGTGAAQFIAHETASQPHRSSHTSRTGVAHE
jgi:hypothetical protein